MNADYNELRFNPQTVDVCYLCSEELNGENSSDHVIPNGLFPPNSPFRPKLPTHHTCNNDKSKSDEWFIRQIQKMGSLNPIALESLNSKLLDKAIVEKENVGIIGKSNKLRNYKLARTILEKDKWGSGIIVNSTGHSTLEQSPETVEKVSEYIKRLARGLYILNIPDANPELPLLQGIQFAGGKATGKYEPFMANVQKFVDLTRGSCFEQQWSGIVRYKGSQLTESPNSGYLYIQFYDQVGFLAVFDKTS